MHIKYYSHYTKLCISLTTATTVTCTIFIKYDQPIRGRTNKDFLYKYCNNAHYPTCDLLAQNYKISIRSSQNRYYWDRLQILEIWENIFHLKYLKAHHLPRVFIQYANSDTSVKDKWILISIEMPRQGKIST